MLHIVPDPLLANWAHIYPRPPPTLLVALQLHEEAYAHLNIQKPMKRRPRRPQINQATTSTKVIIQAIAHIGDQTGIISLISLESMGYDPETLIKLKVRVASVTTGVQQDFRGGIYLSVRSPDTCNQRSTIRLFHVADNVPQNYLSRSCLTALTVADPDSPKISVTTLNTPGLFIPAT